jgi:hypothetical protein
MLLSRCHNSNVSLEMLVSCLTSLQVFTSPSNPQLLLRLPFLIYYHQALGNSLAISMITISFIPTARGLEE